jgi:hypothetical protein
MVELSERLKNFNKQREIPMSVSGISSTNNLNQSDWQSIFSQSQQYFNALSQALQSGNLAGAQNAFSSLQQLAPNSSQNSATTTSANATSSANGTSSIGSDFSALGQALQSGDLAGAQKAFAQLQQDMQTARTGHHHHHHSQASNASAATQDSSATTSSSSTSGNLINLVA